MLVTLEPHTCVFHWSSHRLKDVNTLMSVTLMSSEFRKLIIYSHIRRLWLSKTKKKKKTPPNSVELCHTSSVDSCGSLNFEIYIFMRFSRAAQESGLFFLWHLNCPGDVFFMTIHSYTWPARLTPVELTLATTEELPTMTIGRAEGWGTEGDVLANFLTITQGVSQEAIVSVRYNCICSSSTEILFVLGCCALPDASVHLVYR